MKKSYVVIMLIFVLAMQMQGVSQSCTTIFVGKDATTDGSVIVSHSDDNEMQDQRIIRVPAADHPKGSKRPVYYDPACFGGGIVRYVGKSRGPAYDTPGVTPTKPIGYIDQVPHTYAYFDGSYGIMNEKQLMIGECTDGAKYEPKPKPGKLIFYSAELSRVALERCQKSKDAILLMGKLIEKHGYYGTGETLIVADPKEGWIIEMCASPDGKEGLWVAKRVPDDQLFAAANEFRIRDIDPKDPNILYSANLFKVTKKHGWYNPKDGKLDWLKTVSYGEYNHPYYSLRRVWSIFRRAKPSAKFSPWVKNGFTRDYPFSIKPDKKLSVRDVMALHRDHYEGTQFDMTKGVTAGPFGSPNRYLGKYDGNQNDVNSPGRKMFGAWERPISVFYCGFVYVNQGRSWLPDPIGGVCWFGMDKPYETCFVPFYVGVTKLPRSYSYGSTKKFDKNFSWWAFNFVANLADLKYSYMIKDIKAKQNEIESQEFANQPKIDKKALEIYRKNPDEAKKYLTEYCIENADKVVAQWWDLAFFLFGKYSDGYINIPTVGTEVGYPKVWLEKSGYINGPTKYEKSRLMK
ncbi:MAG: C69 family dipeptidase [Candidatus Eremiobacteraeota bacterium]|nr:C69 family dipeptidase [Candidatus Eremiobacteraeota bacterium]